MMENLTESKVLLEFQERIKDLQLSDATCMRFLIAREFDLDKAENMIRNNVIWRREVNIERIYNSEMPEYMRPDFLFQYTGISKNGGPVFWIPLGTWQARLWVDRGEKLEVIHCSYRILESMLIKVEEMDNKQVFVILDMKELNYYKTCHLESLRVMRDVFQVLEQNFPEILQQAIVVNAPWLFAVGFNFVKPIVSTKTLNKLQVFGFERQEWVPILRNFCLEDSIPKEYL